MFTPFSLKFNDYYRDFKGALFWFCFLTRAVDDLFYVFYYVSVSLHMI